MSNEKYAIAARQWIGAPFHPQAQSVYGCDCFGLVLGVYEMVEQVSIELPSYRISKNYIKNNTSIFLDTLDNIALQHYQLESGNIVLFQLNETLMHCGIIVNSTTFIHAQEKTGVVATRFTEKWQRRLGRIYQFRN